MAREGQPVADEAEKHTVHHMAKVGERQGLDKIFGRIRLARIRFIAGEPEQGSDDGNQALDAAENTTSTKVRKRLRELLADSQPYAQLPRVAELRDRIKTTLC
jgi:hypothetical protein